MAYPLQLADLIADVKSRLNEAVNTTVAQLSSGNGPAPVILSDTTITQYLNEAMAGIARESYPIFDAGSYNVPASTSIVPFNALTVSSGAAIWAARGVSYNGIALIHCGHSVLETWFPTWTVDPPSVPLYWFENGTDGIGIYPSPSVASLPLGVFGLAIPKLLSSSVDVPSIMPDIEKLLVYYAAGQVALKNSEDARLGPKAQIWMTEYDEGRQSLLSRLWRQDPALAQAHYPSLQ
jgi:hypothetical protein